MKDHLQRAAAYLIEYRVRHFVFVLTCTVMLSVVSVIGSPFLYDRGNSGRYLIISYRQMDSQLFQSDPVVNSLERFKSCFYDFIGMLGRISSVTPERMESVVFNLYILLKVVTIIVLYFLARILGGGKWLFILFAGWSCHQKIVPVGGMSVYMPILTHNEAAFVILLFALYQLLARRLLFAWAIIGVTVFIHSLVTFHFVICVLPPLLVSHAAALKQPGLILKSPPVRSLLIGLAFFAACSLLYLVFMSPPKLTAQQLSVFLAVKGDMSHVSIFNQPLYYLTIMVGLLSVTTLSHLTFTRDDDKCKLIHRAMWTGAILASIVSASAVIFRSGQLSLFQPMRIFVWVTSFSFILLGVTAIRALKSSKLSGIVISAILVFLALNTPWVIVCLYGGVAYFSVRLYFSTVISKEMLDKLATIWLTLTGVGIIIGWMLGDRQPFNSLTTSITLVPTLIGFFVLFILPGLKGSQQSWSHAAVAILFIYGLTALSFYNYDYYGPPRVDPEWESVRRWCQGNTDKHDRFITPPEDDNFRSLSLRTSASERTSALVWVDPAQYLDNARIADRAAAGYTNNITNLNYLFGLANEWHCSYVIAKGNLQPSTNAVYHIGKYSVIKVPFNN